MNQEMNALNRNKTYEIIDLPRGPKVVSRYLRAKGSKWIFKVEDKSSGKVERFKAILVAKGYIQEKN